MAKNHVTIMGSNINLNSPKVKSATSPADLQKLGIFNHLPVASQKDAYDLAFKTIFPAKVITENKP